MKRKKRFINILFVMLLLVCSDNTFSQISGPNDIPPDVFVTYTRPAAGTYNYNHTWTVTINNVPSSNVLVVPAGDMVSIKVNKLETNCTIRLSYKFVMADNNYNVISSQIITKDVNIMPFIVEKTIYPGENTNLTIQDNCNHTGCSYLWNVSPLSVCPTCGSSGSNTQNIYINPQSIPSQYVTVNCTMSNCSPAMSSTALNPVSLPVKLRNPSISGPATIGCGGPQPVGNFVYTASQQYGATYYYWSVPGFIQILSGQGTNQITVIETGLGNGSITLQTSNGSGSPGPITSDLVSFPINVCCRSTNNVNTDVTTGNIDKQQSAFYVIANNKVNNGATGQYHGGYQVQLIPGFNAITGSTFHGYIEGCTGVFYRPSNDGVVIDADIESANINLENASLNIEQPKNERYEIKVSPNPNNGSFKLDLTNKEKLPTKILIENIVGSTVHTISDPKEFDYVLNLNEIPNGLFIVKVIYSNLTITKKIIKSN